MLLVTVANEAAAVTLANALLDESLIACANLMPQMRSLYTWQGKRCDDRETLMLLKTRKSLANAVTKRVLELHSYDTPEVLVLKALGGAEKYLKWVDQSVKRPTRRSVRRRS